MEHGIDPTGRISEERLKDVNDSNTTFFAETESNRRVPRAVYVDLEPTVIGVYIYCKLAAPANKWPFKQVSCALNHLLG